MSEEFELPSAADEQLQIVPTSWGPLIGLKSDRITKTLLSEGQYEWAETAILGQVLRAGSTAIDVGANIGHYTALFGSLVGNRGSVHSFEANPFTATLLQRTKYLNSWERVTINAIALGETDGMINVRVMDLGDAMRGGDINLGGWSLSERNDGEWQVPVLKLDRYVREAGIEKLHLMKIDVEGYEMRVLSGSDAVIGRFHPYVMIEMRAENAVDHSRCNETVSYLSERNYVCCRIMKRPFPHLRPIAEADLAPKRYHFNALAIPTQRFKEFEQSMSGAPT